MLCTHRVQMAACWHPSVVICAVTEFNLVTGGDLAFHGLGPVRGSTPVSLKLLNSKHGCEHKPSVSFITHPYT